MLAINNSWLSENKIYVVGVAALAYKNIIRGECMLDKINILYDFQIFWHQKFGGVSRYHAELSNISKQYNINIDISTYGVKNFYLNRNMNKSADLLKLLIGRRKVYLLNKILTKKQLNNKHYDIIHPPWYDPYIFELKGNSKIVVTIHDMIHELFWQDTQQDEIVRKREAIYNSDAIIAISENTKRDILKLYPDIPSDKISVIYHGTSHLPSIKKPSNFQVPEKYILFVGGRHDYKRGMFVAKALKELLEKYADIKILYIGGSNFNKKELQYIEELGLTNRIIQYDVDDQSLAYLYANAICFVYPSLYEGFGLPILEAFDNNCPVICANNSSLPEVGGDAALYFDNEDADKLAEIVEKLFMNNSIRKKYIELGRNRCKEFTWEKCFEETSRVYRRMIGEML